MSSSYQQIRICALFELGERHVVSCYIPTGSPNALVGRELCLRPEEGESKCIQIKGLSTASDVQKSEYDFTYTGDILNESDIGRELVFV